MCYKSVGCSLPNGLSRKLLSILNGPFNEIAEVSLLSISGRKTPLGGACRYSGNHGIEYSDLCNVPDLFTLINGYLKLQNTTS